jgi:choline kinase
MIRRAIILSAGQGSRLLPLTADRPKCLVEVAGKTILSHQVDALAAAGIERRIVVAGYRAEQVAAHLAARSDGTELRINPFWSVSSSIGSVWAARDVLEDDFVLLNGDTVYRPEVLSGALGGAPTGISLLVEPIAEAVQDDMLVAIEGGGIRAVGKSLDPASARFRSLGVVVGRDEGGRYRRALDAVIVRENGIHSFHHQIVHEIAQDEAVHPIVIDGGGWTEIDTPADIEGWKE